MDTHTDLHTFEVLALLESEHIELLAIIAKVAEHLAKGEEDSALKLLQKEVERRGLKPRINPKHFPDWKEMT